LAGGLRGGGRTEHQGTLWWGRKAGGKPASPETAVGVEKLSFCNVFIGRFA